MSIINIFDYNNNSVLDIEGIDAPTSKFLEMATLKFFNSVDITLLQKIVLRNIIEYTPNNVLKLGLTYEFMGETFESAGFISDMWSIVSTVNGVYNLDTITLVSSKKPNEVFLKLLFDDSFKSKNHGIQQYLDVVSSVDGYVEIYDDIDESGNLHHSSTAITELLEFINSIFKSCAKTFTGSCDDWFPYVRSRLLETAKPELRLNKILGIIEDTNTVTDVDVFSDMVNLCDGRDSWFYDHQIDTSCIILREKLADMKAISRIFGNNYHHVNSSMGVPKQFACDIMTQIGSCAEELIVCELLESKDELRYNLVSSETTNNRSNVILISYEFLKSETIKDR